MTVKAVLWTYKPRKNGTCNIKIYVHRGKQKKYLKTEHYARPEEWNPELGRLHEVTALSRKINALLGKLEHEALSAEVGVQTSLLQFIAGHVKECEEGRHDVAINTVRQYKSHLNRLRGFVASSERLGLAFEDVDLLCYTELKKYLMGTGCGPAGTAKHIRILKKFMRLSWELGMHTNEAFRLKAFSGSRVPAKKKVYLSPEEIERITNLNLDHQPGLAKERDRFLISYYLLLRYGDSVKISKGNVTESGGQLYYQNRSEKTKDVSFIPIKPVVLAILERHNYNLSGGANQDSNRKLKAIAAMAGINTNVGVEGWDGNSQIFASDYSYGPKERCYQPAPSWRSDIGNHAVGGAGRRKGR